MTETTRERLRVQSVYLVCDASLSMTDLREMSDGLAELRRWALADSSESHRLRFSILSSSGSTDTLFGFSGPAEPEALPLRSVGGLTNYASIFRALAVAMSSDVQGLRAQGFAVMRPMVLFFSGGASTDRDDWISAHSDLVGAQNAFRPHIWAVGLESSDLDLLRRVATEDSSGLVLAFTVNGGFSLGEVLSEFVSAVSRSMGASRASRASAVPLEFRAMTNVADGSD